MCLYIYVGVIECGDVEKYSRKRFTDPKSPIQPKTVLSKACLSRQERGPEPTPLDSKDSSIQALEHESNGTGYSGDSTHVGKVLASTTCRRGACRCWSRAVIRKPHINILASTTVSIMNTLTLSRWRWRFGRWWYQWWLVPMWCQRKSWMERL